MPPEESPGRPGFFPSPPGPRSIVIVEEEVRKGRQAFIVYPLVEESEKTGSHGCHTNGGTPAEGRSFRSFGLACSMAG